MHVYIKQQNKMNIENKINNTKNCVNLPNEVSITQLAFEDNELRIIDNKTAEYKKREIELGVEKCRWADEQIHQREGRNDTNGSSQNACKWSIWVN